ncbi:MAG: phosphate ABC transporter permease subunit PstC [Candidatus Omnitrophica bacterium]|nr:phosphate ABC transporter permease subunit PstC [Candidatus Omnitrophota bacterium]
MRHFHKKWRRRLIASSRKSRSADLERIESLIKKGAPRGRLIDEAFRIFVGVLAWSSVGLAVLLFLVLLRESWPSIRQFGWAFLWSSEWDAVKEHFGILPVIYGTLVSSLLALIFAVPLSMGIAIFLSELGPPWIRKPLAALIELLAAIPSVIYGLWGIFVLCPVLRTVVEPFLGKHFGFLPLFQGPSYGVGMLAAGIILSIMIIPTISSISREIFLTIPTPLKEGALALGATRWEMIQLAVLPPSRSGILGAVLLGLGRALGETMAVTMVIGNRHDISLSLFEPAYTMASLIANEFSEATTPLYTAALVETGLVLLIVTLILNIIARVLVWSVSRQVKGVPA